MSLCVRSNNFVSFYDLYIGCWKCSDRMLFFVFHFISSVYNITSIFQYNVTITKITSGSVKESNISLIFMSRTFIQHMGERFSWFCPNKGNNVFHRTYLFSKGLRSLMNS
jgi:hypothetical protein